MTGDASVLILEDEPIVALALEDMLLELGFQSVSVATTIEEAFGKLDELTPDVAVLDVNIRGNRSYGVAETLIDLNVPFVFATGYGDAEHSKAFMGIRTLTKPYSQQQLRAALIAAMRRRPGFLE